MEIREKVEKQNFTIQPARTLENTVTNAHIGIHGGKGIDNIIDQEDLKRSHKPIYNEVDKMPYNRSAFIKEIKKTNLAMAQSKNEYHNFKTGSTMSKVPFAPEKRNRLEKSYSKFDKPNGYGQSVNKQTYSWKIPTYDLNP